MFRQRRRVLAIALAVIVVAIAAVFGIRIATAEPPQSTAIELPEAVVSTPPAVNWQAVWDKEDLDALLAEHGSGYDCLTNANAKKIADLKLCPDYTATLSFNDLGKPAIVTSIAMFGIQPITLTADYIKSCGNDGVEGEPIRCSDMWRVRWTIRKEYVALGQNEQNTWEDGRVTWTGPIGPDKYSGDQLIDPKDTQSFEVYAGDPLTNISDTPLSDAQMAKS
jgi:hypothetical protein